jgi:hypothetical protein
MPMLSPGTVPGHLLSRCPHDPLCGSFREGPRRPGTHQRDKHTGDPAPAAPQVSTRGVVPRLWWSTEEKAARTQALTASAP